MANNEAPMLLYEPDGRFARVVATPGEGPLEYRSITNVIREPSEGRLAAFDYFGKILYLDSTGSPVGTRYPGTPAVRPDAFNGDGWSVQEYYRKIAEDSVLPFGIVRDPGGDSALSVGPGATPDMMGHQRIGSASPGVAILDSVTVIGRSADLQGIALWTPDGVHDLVGGNEIADHFGERGAEMANVSALILRDARFIWTATAFAPSSSPPTGVEGYLRLTSISGDVLGVTALGDRPRGFADEEHVYTVREYPSGLITFRAYRFRFTCG